MGWKNTPNVEKIMSPFSKKRAHAPISVSKSDGLTTRKVTFTMRHFAGREPVRFTDRNWRMSPFLWKRAHEKTFSEYVFVTKKKDTCPTRGCQNKTQDAKPGPPIILERFLIVPDVVGIIEGSRFLPKIIDFASRNVTWVREGSWTRIVTINNIDALCGSKRAHASSDQKYHAFLGKIQSPFFYY